MTRYSNLLLTLIAALLLALTLAEFGVVPRRPPAPAPSDIRDTPFAVSRLENGATYCYVLKSGELKTYELEASDEPGNTGDKGRLVLRNVTPLPAGTQPNPPPVAAQVTPVPKEVLPNIPALQTLADALPADDQPRAGPSGRIERALANRRLSEKLKKGIPIEFKARIGSVDAAPNGDDNPDQAFTGRLSLGVADPSGRDGGIIGAVHAGGSDWSVFAKPMYWKKMDVSSAKKLRDSQGKDVTIKAQLEQFMFINETGQPTAQIHLFDIIVDGVTTLPGVQEW